jgi:hypothetical protein
MLNSSRGLSRGTIPPKNPSTPSGTEPTWPPRLHQRAAALVMLTGFLTASVQAAGAVSPLPQPTVDLGETSFLDGEAGPGGLLEVIGNGYTANYVTDSRGNAVSGTNSEASTSLTLAWSRKDQPLIVRRQRSRVRIAPWGLVYGCVVS